MLDATSSRLWVAAHADLVNAFVAASGRLGRALAALRPRLGRSDRERLGVALLVSVPVALSFIGAAIAPAVA